MLETNLIKGKCPGIRLKNPQKHRIRLITTHEQRRQPRITDLYEPV